MDTFQSASKPLQKRCENTVKDGKSGAIAQRVPRSQVGDEFL